MKIVYEYTFGAVIEVMRTAEIDAIAQRLGWPVSRWVRVRDVPGVGRCFVVVDVEADTAEHWTPSASDMLDGTWAIFEEVEEDAPHLWVVR